jgi:ribosomal protein S21
MKSLLNTTGWLIAYDTPVRNNQHTDPLGGNLRMLIKLHEPSLEDIETAVRQLKEMMSPKGLYPQQKIRVRFQIPTQVKVNRQKSAMLSSMDVSFFRSTTGRFCYTFHRRTGFPVDGIDYRNVSSLSIEKRDAVTGKEIERIKSLGRSIHPNAWNDLKKKIEEEPLSYRQYGLARIDISRNFPARVIEELGQAFDLKQDYRYEKPGEKRDLTVSTKLCEDGVLRAWFSSEYSGCGNGAYYLLLNPRLASFCEYD